jgi:DNA-binding NtrC family response regulator
VRAARSSEAALDRLVDHHWPGNVRELRHVMQQACVMSSAEILDAGDLELRAEPAAIEADAPRLRYFGIDREGEG